MAVSKVQKSNGDVLIDLTSDTVTPSALMSGYTAHDKTGALITGTATGGSPTLQTKSVSYTPTETAQSDTVTADSGYDGLDVVNVSVGAISSTYVGTGITRRSSSDLTASGATVTVPSGYYSAQASKAVASGTAGTPTATKGTVSNHSVSVTPSVTNTAGYISGGTKTGTAVTVSASELVSGSQTLAANGTTDVTNLASVTVSIPFVTYYTGSSTPSSSLGQNGDIYLNNSGGGSSVTVQPLSVTENGTYTAPSGTAYSPVSVNVSSGGGSAELGTFTMSTDTNISNFCGCYCLCKPSSYSSLPYVPIKAFSTTSAKTYKYYKSEDGYMYVTFWGAGNNYSPVVTATSGTVTYKGSCNAGNAVQSSNPNTIYGNGDALVWYKVSDGAVLKLSYENVN